LGLNGANILKIGPSSTTVTYSNNSLNTRSGIFGLGTSYFSMNINGVFILMAEVTPLLKLTIYHQFNS
jgi:hypothetical protein